MMLRRLVAAMALVLSVLLLAAPASALVPTPASPASSASAAATTAPAIGETVESGSDDRIARRLLGIFTELPAFRQVQVAVRAGVVTLSGTVPTQDDIARAEGIASRVSGVVTVENQLTRDVSLKSSAAGVGSVASKLAGFAKLLPLIAVALATWLVIAIAGYLLARLGGLWRRVAPNPFLAELIASAIRFVFVIGGLIVALNIVGATALLGAVLGGAGVIGVALGFAMRDTVENYVASLMLSLRQPFRANDHVVIDGHEGRVVRLTSRATILMTLDGNHLRLPNSAVFKAVILNYTRNPQRRFEFVLQVDDKIDPSPARTIGLEALARLDFVLSDPPPVALVTDVLYPNTGVQFRAWIDQTQADYNKARTRALIAVKRALDTHGLAIPDPVTKVQMVESERGPEAPQVEHTANAAVQADVAPEPAVARMIASERDQSPGDRDLLDSSKPVE